MKNINKILLLSIIIVLMLIIILILILVLSNSNTKNEIERNNIIENIENNVTVNNQTNQDISNKKDEELDNIKEEYLNKINYEDIVEEEKSKLKDVEDSTQYFTIKALYDNYVTLIKNNNSQKLMNVLASEYINKYEINEENVINKLSNAKKINNKECKTIIMEMLVSQLNDTYKLFIVKGNCRVTKTDEIFEANIIVKVNTKEKIYEIYPQEFMKDNKYDILKTGDSIQFSTKEIIKNDSNSFSYLIKEDDGIAKEYFNHYKELLRYYPKVAYTMLEGTYTMSRFGDTNIYNPLMEIENATEESIDELLEELEKKQVIEMEKNYNQYLKSNKTRISSMQFQGYKVIKEKDYTEYIAQDKYKNIMSFKTTNSFLNYTVKLDNNSEFEEVEDVKDKILILQNMINTKDYTAIYNILDTTFKNNNFKKVSDLEKYIEKYFYNLNELAIINITEEENCICKCRVTNILRKSETKVITIILNDNVLSFNITDK